MTMSTATEEFTPTDDIDNTIAMESSIETTTSNSLSVLSLYNINKF